MSRNDAAATNPEYATARIAVWWDMNDCRIPGGYDARRIRPNIEGAFEKLGYSGPVSITAYADHKQTPDDLLRGLSSTGIDVAQTKFDRISTGSIMISDMLEWVARNPPPATMMVITNNVEDVFAWNLVRIQQEQETTYNLFLAYSAESSCFSIVVTSAEWVWESLLDDKHETGGELSARFYCKPCSFCGESLENFRKHLRRNKHAVRQQEARNSCLVGIGRGFGLGRNYAAMPEYATAPVEVWWDMMDCPIPKGYDARRIRWSIERELKNLGYSGHVSITAYVDPKQIPDRHRKSLSSTGVVIEPATPDIMIYRGDRDRAFLFMSMLEHMLERRRNPPPGTLMLISNNVDEVVSSSNLFWLQKQMNMCNLFLAYSARPRKNRRNPLLVTSAEWLWENLLESKPSTYQLLSLKHALEEAREMVKGKNYAAKPEYATAQIAVWWDMNDCPIPKGYDARQIRPSIEAAFQKLGYSGPVSITAYADLNNTPDDDLLRGLSSTGVAVAHAITRVRLSRMSDDLRAWRIHNPPPATLMLISDGVEEVLSNSLVRAQQLKKYNMFLAYSSSYPSRPSSYKMSALVTCAEWLWETLLAVSESESETRTHGLQHHGLQQCSDMDESTQVFYCKMCFCYYTDSDDFREHLSSKGHKDLEASLNESYQSNKKNKMYWRRQAEKALQEELQNLCKKIW